MPINRAGRRLAAVATRCACVLPTAPSPCSLMAELHRQFEAAGGTTAFYSRVEGGAVGSPGPLRLAVRDVNSGEAVELTAGLVVNAAGLHAQVRCGAWRRAHAPARMPAARTHEGAVQVPGSRRNLALLQAVASSLAGLPPASIPALHLAKGNYFSLAPSALAILAPGRTDSSGGSAGSSGSYGFSHLVYPLPEPGTAGLGTHLTLDLAGEARFGPDVEWCAGQSLHCTCTTSRMQRSWRHAAGAAPGGSPPAHRLSAPCATSQAAARHRPALRRLPGGPSASRAFLPGHSGLPARPAGRRAAAGLLGGAVQGGRAPGAAAAAAGLGSAHRGAHAGPLRHLRRSRRPLLSHTP